MVAHKTIEVERFDLARRALQDIDKRNTGFPQNRCEPAELYREVIDLIDFQEGPLRIGEKTKALGICERLADGENLPSEELGYLRCILSHVARYYHSQSMRIFRQNAYF